MSAQLNRIEDALFGRDPDHEGVLTKLGRIDERLERVEANQEAPPTHTHETRSDVHATSSGFPKRTAAAAAYGLVLLADLFARRFPV